jgi:hypothetical protein
MPPVQVILLCAALGGLYLGGRAIGHGVKVAAVKTKHAIVHVVHPKKQCPPKS